jgi:hypothetical protein
MLSSSSVGITSTFTLEDSDAMLAVFPLVVISFFPGSSAMPNACKGSLIFGMLWSAAHLWFFEFYKLFPFLLGLEGFGVLQRCKCSKQLVFRD